MGRGPATFAVAACIALAAGGCGSDSSSDSATLPDGLTTEATSPTAPGIPTAPTGAADGGGASKGASKGGAQRGSGSDRTPATGDTPATPTISPEKLERLRARAQARAKAQARAAGNRIKNFGAAAKGAKKAAIAGAMQSFMRALAAGEYVRVCTGLDSEVREGLERFAARLRRGQSCAALLSSSALADRATDARRAANGTVTAVRIGGGEAYVIFRPGADGPLSYVVMRRDGNAWKAGSLGTGTPVYPPVPTLPLLGQ